MSSDAIFLIISGTPEYMAPEMVIGSPPTSYAADLWAIGVITHQLLTGRTPFKAASPYLSFLRIKRCHLLLPDVLSSSAADLISSLVVFNPEERLGIAGATPGDLARVKDHAFFSHLPREFEGLHSAPVERVPRLSELCVRAAARATLTSRSRNKLLLDLRHPDRCSMMHYLAQLQRLQEPRVLRGFYPSLSDTRCLQAQASTREMIGLEHEHQAKWVEPFALVHLNVGALLSSWDDAGGLAAQNLKKIVSAINRLRPRVCTISIGYNEGVTDDTLASFRQAFARVSESIPLAFIAASDNAAACSRHRLLFGADYFGFWFGGMRALVLNSALIVDEEVNPSASTAQEAWFDGEVEQGQLGGHHVLVFSHHPWFKDSPIEENQGCGAIPHSVRHRWLRKMMDGKVRAVLTTPPTSMGNHARQVQEDDILRDSKDADSDSDSDEDTTKEPVTIEFVATAGSDTGDSEGLRVISVFESSLEHRFFSLSDIPDRTELFRVTQKRK